MSFLFDIRSWRTAEVVNNGDVFNWQNKKVETGLSTWKRIISGRYLLWHVKTIKI